MMNRFKNVPLSGSYLFVICLFVNQLECKGWCRVRDRESSEGENVLGFESVCVCV